MKNISYTVVTENAQALDIEFPLHPQTQSEAAITDMVTDLLGTLSNYVVTNRKLSDGDLLQALAMTLAVRARMVKDDPDMVDKLSHELLESALQAVRESIPYTASRA
jgi:hypothetical protein